ncbi:4Fe-4S binding protein [Ruminococcus sp.]|uniref:4Fe-4S binding protein n=1 Tax=Ruminococcus sp. TaxID=41978 RepID=UPI00351FED8A
MNCIGCKACETVCPQNCIDFSTVTAKINENNCLHCGNCMTVCPQNAVVKIG